MPTLIDRRQSTGLDPAMLGAGRLTALTVAAPAAAPAEGSAPAR